jgi:succinate-semialdehyde dehydrogenase/glutarate-semialdehyde dehydrogenase
MSNKVSSINPYTNQLIAEYDIHTTTEINRRLEQTSKAQLEWAALSVAARAKHLDNLAQHLLDHKLELGHLATAEMGKPVKQSLAEIEKSARTLKYYATQAANFLAPEKVVTEAQSSYVSFQPLGTILAIMPWNFPYWQVFRAMGPILMAGNAMILKHASNVTGCALAIEKAVLASGLPPNVFQTVVVPGSQVESIIQSPYIQAITLTGSSAAGASVAATAGKVLKKQVLELGGSDAYLILKDADLDLAAQACVTSRLNNSGQSCIGAKRFIVDSSIQDVFTEKVVHLMSIKKWGNPLDDTTDVGPMARKDLRDELHQQVLKSVSLGATLLCGGYIPDDATACYPPTVLAKVAKGMPAYDEELFGPVAAIIEAQDTEDVIF